VKVVERKSPIMKIATQLPVPSNFVNKADAECVGSLKATYPLPAIVTVNRKTP
jgi:hypothetical protein